MGGSAGISRPPGRDRASAPLGPLSSNRDTLSGTGNSAGRWATCISSWWRVVQWLQTLSLEGQICRSPLGGRPEGANLSHRPGVDLNERWDSGTLSPNGVTS